MASADLGGFYATLTRETIDLTKRTPMSRTNWARTQLECGRDQIHLVYFPQCTLPHPAVPKVAFYGHAPALAAVCHCALSHIASFDIL